MPNWNANSLTVTNGEKFIEDIRQMADEDGKVKNLFARFVPMPPVFLGIQTGLITIDGQQVTKWVVGLDGTNVPVDDETIAKMKQEYGAGDWYAWSIQNWGTKWDADVEVLDDGSLTFDTAWGPPDQFLVTLSKQYPETIFRLAYSEGGIGFYGYMDVRNGTVLQETNSEDFWQKDIDWDKIDDPMDALTDHCREHIEDYGLHVGG